MSKRFYSPHFFWLNVMLSGIFCMGWTASTRATSIVVNNHSFEEIGGQPLFNEFTLVLPHDWVAYNPSSLSSGSGLYFGTLDTDGTFFDFAPNPAPDGDRVAILYNQTQKGSGEYGIEQTLTNTLQSWTQYTLTVEVGNIGSGTSDSGDFYDLSGFPGYRIDLLAGTNVVASSSTNTLVIPERVFAMDTVYFETAGSSPYLGSALGIRLVSLNSPVEADSNQSPFDAHEVDFDDVRLDATAIPVDGYDIWADRNGVGLPNADDDGDGRLNLFEYALNGDPNGVGDLGFEPTFSKIEMAFEYSHLKRNDDSNLIYTVQIRENLMTGSWATADVGAETNLFNASYDQVIHTIPVENSPRYLRLSVEHQE